MNIKKLYKSVFIRNVVVVATGSTGAQVITIAFSPLVTRIYGPEAFGLLGTFLVFLSIFFPISALTYPVAIVLAETDNEAKKIARLSFYISFLFSSFLGLMFFYLKDMGWGNSIQNLMGYLWLIPLAMFFNSLQQILQQWLIRKRAFKLTARALIFQAFVLNSLKVILGLVFPYAYILIFIASFGGGLYVLQLLFGINRWKDKSAHINRSFLINDGDNMRDIAIKYKDFPLYRTPQVFLNSITQGVPIFLLLFFFGPAIAGFFSLSKSVLSAPVFVIGNSIGNVFYSYASKAANNGEDYIYKLHRATALTFLVGLFPFLIIIAFGPLIFKFIFGEEWYEAGRYARWMAVWLLFSLSSRPLISVIPILGLQRFFLFFEISFSFFVFLSLWIPSYFFSDSYLAIVSYSLVSMFFYIFLYLFVLFRIALDKK